MARLFGFDFLQFWFQAAVMVVIVYKLAYKDAFLLPDRIEMMDALAVSVMNWS